MGKLYNFIFLKGGQAILITPNLKTKLNVCGFCLAGMAGIPDDVPVDSQLKAPSASSAGDS